MAAHTLTTQVLVSARITAGVTALLLGVFLVWGAGLANSATLHDTAHDTRHSYGFPATEPGAMIVRYLLAALVAGLVSGLFMTGFQHLRVVPLILAAEAYEQPVGHHGETAAEALSQPQSPAHAHEKQGAGDGLGRLWGTLLANLVTGTGFALLLAGVSLLSGTPVTLANGLLWGACGWLAVQLLPALGLPPELPGFPAADLQARQLWWVATVACSAAGLWALALRGDAVSRIAGLALIAAPHIVGAPQPQETATDVPALLAADYAVAALATTLAFWLVLGLALGWFNKRLGAVAP